MGTNCHLYPWRSSLHSPFFIIALSKRIQKLKSCTSSTHIPSALSANLYTQCPVYDKKDKDNSRLKTHPQVDNLQLFYSSSDLSTPMQCCSDKHTDSSQYSDSDSGHTSPHRQTPIITTQYPPYLYHNMPALQEDTASELCSLVGRETTI